MAERQVRALAFLALLVAGCQVSPEQLAEHEQRINERVERAELAHTRVLHDSVRRTAKSAAKTAALSVRLTAVEARPVVTPEEVAAVGSQAESRLEEQAGRLEGLILTVEQDAQTGLTSLRSVSDDRHDKISTAIHLERREDETLDQFKLTLFGLLMKPHEVQFTELKTLVFDKINLGQRERIAQENRITRLENDALRAQRTADRGVTKAKEAQSAIDKITLGEIISWLGFPAGGAALLLLFRRRNHTAKREEGAA